jgi:hypothetical protein
MKDTRDDVNITSYGKRMEIHNFCSIIAECRKKTGLNLGIVEVIIRAGEFIK